jgi:hypothetical protein
MGLAANTHGASPGGAHFRVILAHLVRVPGAVISKVSRILLRQN